MATKYTYQLPIKYTNVILCRTLQNLPKLGFLVRKYAIWQPSDSAKIFHLKNFFCAEN
jgi:hypothetical protein